MSRVLAVKQLYGDIRLVLQCIQKSPFFSDILNDEIIMAAIKVLASQTKEVGLSCLLLPSIPGASEGWKWVPNGLGMRLRVLSYVSLVDGRTIIGCYASLLYSLDRSTNLCSC